jgi:hypothetical protein
LNRTSPKKSRTSGVWKAGIVRENYARADEPGVVIVFECASADECKRYTDNFPLTRAGRRSDLAEMVELLRPESRQAARCHNRARSCVFYFKPPRKETVMKARVDFAKVLLPTAMQALNPLAKYVNSSGLDHRLLELVKMRSLPRREVTSAKRSW